MKAATPPRDYCAGMPRSRMTLPSPRSLSLAMMKRIECAPGWHHRTPHQIVGTRHRQRMQFHLQQQSELTLVAVGRALVALYPQREGPPQAGNERCRYRRRAREARPTHARRCVWVLSGGVSGCRSSRRPGSGSSDHKSGRRLELPTTTAQARNLHTVELDNERTSSPALFVGILAPFLDPHLTGLVPPRPGLPSSLQRDRT